MSTCGCKVQFTLVSNVKLAARGPQKNRYVLVKPKSSEQGYT